MGFEEVEVEMAARKRVVKWDWIETESSVRKDAGLEVGPDGRGGD